MRIVHVNATSSGGAARAMLRLHRGLLSAGVDSICLTNEGVIGLPVALELPLRGPISRRLLPRLDKLPLRLYPHRQPGEFNLQWVPGGILGALEALSPDVVHLHWICQSFVRIENLRRIHQPLLWTLHDAWAMTGGCHVLNGCDGFTTGCGCCPQLGSATPLDLSRWVWRRKERAWRDVPMTLAVPSRWLAGLVSQSPLLRSNPLRVTPNGLDTERFQPMSRDTAREILGLPPQKTLVLFGAVSALSDRNKGFHHLAPALAEAARLLPGRSMELVVFGAEAPETHMDMGTPVCYMGIMHDDISLRLLYAAADVTVVPSGMEAFGQVGSESLACGTPVVAFQNTGLSDIIDHGSNGFLAAHGDALSLGEGIAHILAHPDPQALRKAARAKAESCFSLRGMAASYTGLYQEVMQRAHTARDAKSSQEVEPRA